MRSLLAGMTLITAARLPLALLAAVLLLASPSMAEKQLIGEQDLDRVSAAGICVSGPQACDASDEDSGRTQASVLTRDKIGMHLTATAVNSLDLNQAQQGTRTSILNNIVGVSQVANGINLFGGTHR